MKAADRRKVVAWMAARRATAKDAIAEFGLDVAPRTVQLWRKRYAAPTATASPTPARSSPRSTPWDDADAKSKRLVLDLLRARAVELLEAEVARHLAGRRGLLEAPTVERDGPPVEDDGDAAEERRAQERQRKLDRAVELLTEGVEAYSSKEVAAHLGLTVADVRQAVVSWMADQDLDDAQVARRIGTTAKEIRKWKARGARPAASEQMNLKETANGEIRSSFSNLCEILAHDPWWKGRLRWCEFSFFPLIRVGASEDFVQLRDADLRMTEKWASDAYGVDFEPSVVRRAILFEAEQHPWHPVRSYLDGLVWDGVPRLDTMLVKYFRCADDELTAPFGRKWLISAVARVRDPGCKVDTVLTFCGHQGLKKSTGFEVLVGSDWFSDDKINVTSKDGLMLLEGKWMIELAELATLSHADMNEVKSWITRKVDRYRPPFGHLVEKHPRQSILVGTTNDLAPLRDPTGARRFWIRTVLGVADVDALARDRDQLWAEAAYLYDRDLGTEHHWWLTPAEKVLAERLADQRREPHAWSGFLIRWLDDNQFREPTSTELLEEALKLSPATLKGWENRALGEVMRELGYEKYKPNNGERRWRKTRP